ncbi:unnamed protein product, partial [Cuscuta campestris]
MMADFRRRTQRWRWTATGDAGRRLLQLDGDDLLGKGDAGGWLLQLDGDEERRLAAARLGKATCDERQRRRLLQLYGGEDATRRRRSIGEEEEGGGGDVRLCGSQRSEGKKIGLVFGALHCEWFHKLPKGSIDKWGDLAHKFLEHFASSRRQKLPFSHLLNVKIRKGEQLREFINRWEKEARDVQGADDQALIAMLQAALPQGDVRKELRRNPLSTYQEMLARAKYLALEEEDDEPQVRKEKKSGPPVAEGKKRKDYGKGPNPTGYHANRHPVHAVQSLPAPPHGRESYGVQDAPKYCEYHRNSTHNTSECVTLRKEMDQLIARGPPPRSERPSTSNRTWRRPPAPTAAITAGEGQEDGRRHLGRDCDDLDEEERQGRRHLGCRFIMGGNTGGDSVSSRKKWKNMVYLAEVQWPPLPKRKKKEPLIFTDEDYPPVLSPHRDALVIRVEINNVVVHRTLVDTGSSVNVMYSNTFKDLGLSRSDLKPIHTPLSGFTGDTIEVEGTITVKAGVGDGTHRLWVDMEFM